MDKLFLIAMFVLGLVIGIGLTLCLAALAVESVGNPHETDTDYL